jgi:hypothetical protein
MTQKGEQKEERLSENRLTSVLSRASGSEEEYLTPIKSFERTLARLRGMTGWS